MKKENYQSPYIETWSDAPIEVLCQSSTIPGLEEDNTLEWE